MNAFDQIQAGLAAHRPHTQTDPSKKQAAVAAILHPRDDDLYILFIERAAHPKDPWSGHIAFPGGTIEPQDKDLKATAEREAYEELSIRLSQATHLGRLDDVTGATLPINVAGFVYAINQYPDLCLNDEVCDVFWTPFVHITDPTRRQTLHLTRWGDLRQVPAIDLLGPDRPLLWGLTYRLIAQLTSFIGHELPDIQ